MGDGHQRQKTPNANAQAQRLIDRGRKLLEDVDNETGAERAETLFRRVTVLVPDDIAAWRGLADALYELEQFDEALKAYHRAIALGADQDPMVWRSLGLAASMAGEAEEAVMAAERAIVLASDNTEVLEGCAQVFTLVAMARLTSGAEERHNLLIRALIALDQLLGLESPHRSLTPSAAWALRGRGALLIQIGRTEEALTTFEQLARLAPVAESRTIQSSAAWEAACGRALALNRLGQHKEALTILEEGMKREPNPELDWKVFRGKLLLRVGRQEEALNVADFILRSRPRHVAALLLRAQALDALARPVDAEKAHVAAAEAQANQENQNMKVVKQGDPFLALLLPA